MTRTPHYIPILLACLLVSVSTPIQADELAELRKQNAELKAANVQLQQEVEALKAAIAKLDTKLNQNSQASQQLQTQVEDLSAEKQRLEALAGVTAKGEIVASQIARFQSTYDEAADQTTVSGPAQAIDFDIDVVVPPHQLRFLYTYPGREATTPPQQYTLTLTTVKNTHKRYKKAEHLQLVLDGEPMRLAVSQYELVKTHRTASARSSMKRYDERISFTLTPEALRRFARATEASARFSTMDLPLTREHIALAKATLERSQLLVTE